MLPEAARAQVWMPFQDKTNIALAMPVAENESERVRRREGERVRE